MAVRDKYHRARRLLLVLLAIAFVVSVVHYVDNYVNYDDYPLPGPDSNVPAPSAALVGAGWFIFTAFGVAGLWAFWKRRFVPAAVFLALYSGSGLVGFGHYAVPGATAMVWWRQTHVVLDILCGIAVFGFAIWTVTALREKSGTSHIGT